MTKMPTFQTNLSLVPNTTKLLLVAEAHNYWGARLHAIRSTLHLSKQSYNSFLYEKPENVQAVYAEEYKLFTNIVKKHGKAGLEFFLSHSQNERYFQESKNAILKWEADNYKIKTFYCDDKDFHQENKIDLNNSIVDTAIIKTFGSEVPLLQAQYNFSNDQIITDLRYAMYGEKTFLNYSSKLNAATNYKEDLAKVGIKLRKSITEDFKKEDELYKMNDRNLSIAKKIFQVQKLDPYFKGYGLFGLYHITPMGNNNFHGIGDILQQEYNINSIKVGTSNLTRIIDMSKKFKQDKFDVEVISPEEVLPFSNVFFKLNATELLHVLQDDVQSLSEGINKVKDPKRIGLDFEIIIPDYSEEDYKSAIIKKICSKF